MFAPYHASRRSTDSLRDLRAYFVKRASRLLPLCYLTCLVGIIFVMSAGWRVPFLYISMATATFVFDARTYFPNFNTTLWSIGIEIRLSIAFPILVVGYRKLGIGKLFALIAALSMTVRIIGNADAFYGLNPVLNYVKDSFLGRLDDLALGMVIACVYHRYKDRALNEGWLALSFFVGLGFLFLTASVWDAIQLNPELRKLAPVTNSMFHVGSFLSATAVLLCKNRITRFVFANPIIQLLGMMCYSLYVWHFMVLSRFGQIEACIILLLLTYRYVEFGRAKDVRSLFATPRMWPV